MMEEYFFTTTGHLRYFPLHLHTHIYMYKLSPHLHTHTHTHTFLTHTHIHRCTHIHKYTHKTMLAPIVHVLNTNTHRRSYNIWISSINVGVQMMPQYMLKKMDKKQLPLFEVHQRIEIKQHRS